MKKIIKTILIAIIVISIIFITIIGLGYSPILTFFGDERLCSLHLARPLDYYSTESLDVANNLSQNQIVNIVEYIRDSIIANDQIIKVGKIEDSNIFNNEYYYFGYQSTLPGVNFQKAWKLSPEATNEIPYDEYLRAWNSSTSSDLPDAIYSIHFFEVDYGDCLCVMVVKKYYFKTYNSKQPWYVDTWSFNKVFPGKWEFKRILTGTSSYDPR